MTEIIDKFTKMILMLKGNNQALGEENETMILLYYIPSDYHVVINALQYTSVVPKFDLVVTSIKVRELELNTFKRTSNSSNLYAKEKNRKEKGKQE